jgi:hypothetical protein
MESTINILAKNPPSIAIALGAMGLLLNMPYGGLIFFVGVILQIIWLIIKSRLF